MKLLSKVVWFEGMYLGPQHFQAQNRYFEEAVHFATSSLWKDAYGFAAGQIDADALRNGVVNLRHVRGIFEDGLAFDIPECDAPAPAPLSVADKFQPTADHITVSLAVPRWVSGKQNCSLDSASDPGSRYTGVLESFQDENTGRDEKPIQMGRKNFRLVFDPQPGEDLLTLPLARIMRDGSGHFIFDPTFIPPCLQISASERLTTMLQRLVEILEDKS